MANTFTDGNIIADSFEADIDGLVYVVNNLSLTTPTVATERNDHKGRLAAKKTERDRYRMNGTAELQISKVIKNRSLIHRKFFVPADANSTGQELEIVIEEETANVAANESRTRSINVRLIVYIIYASSDGADDVLISAGCADAGSAIYRIKGKVRPKGSFFNVQISGSIQSAEFGSTENVWNDFTSATMGGFPSDVAVGFNTEDDYRDIQLINTDTGKPVANWSLDDQESGSLNGVTAVDSLTKLLSFTVSGEMFTMTSFDGERATYVGDSFQTLSWDGTKWAFSTFSQTSSKDTVFPPMNPDDWDSAISFSGITRGGFDGTHIGGTGGRELQ